MKQALQGEGMNAKDTLALFLPGGEHIRRRPRAPLLSAILADYKNLSCPGSKEEVRTEGESSLPSAPLVVLSSPTSSPLPRGQFTLLLWARGSCLSTVRKSCIENLEGKEKFSSYGQKESRSIS